MALETLKGLERVDGFKVKQDSTKPWADDEYIGINHDTNTLTFKIQNGPVKENGINGCQVDQLISVASSILQGLDKNFKSFDNAIAIQSLATATLALQNRKREREARGVEGYNKA